MINKIRNDLELLKGKKIKFRYNGSRNQIEEFEGIINNCYNYVFTIDLDYVTKSFSYSDVLIGVIDIDI